MNRRGFLKLMGRGAAAVAAAPVLAKLPALATPGAGSIPAAGPTPAILPLVTDNDTGMAFGTALWPGIQKWYGEAYKEIKGDYHNLYDL